MCVSVCAYGMLHTLYTTIIARIEKGLSIVFARVTRGCSSLSLPAGVCVCVHMGRAHSVFGCRHPKPLRLFVYCVLHHRLARIEDATAQALQAVARIEQRVQQQQQDQDHKHQLPEEASSAAASQPDVVDGEPSALDSLLAALERVEQQEREIHERWFGNGSGSNRDAGSNDSDGISILATGQCEAAGDAIIQPPQGPSQSAKQMVSQLSQPQPCGDVLSDAAVKAIKGGRQRLLRHQAMLDGTLHELGSGGDVTGSSRSKKNRNSSSRSSTLLRPTQVVEAVADLLLDELLLDEARDLDGFCDALCTQLFEDEFVEP